MKLKACYWLQVTQPVGVQSLNQSATDWYGRDPRYGVGRRECEYITPELQVCALTLWPYDCFPHSGCRHTQLSCSRHGTAIFMCNDCNMAQVRHRCRCQNQTICGEEAQMIERLALLGKLVPNAKPVDSELS